MKMNQVLKNAVPTRDTIIPPGQEELLYCLVVFTESLLLKIHNIGSSCER